MKQLSDFEAPIEKAVRKRDIKFDIKIGITRSCPLPNLEKLIEVNENHDVKS
jgi:hypothetical protein